jgi:hypothetical protein
MEEASKSLKERNLNLVDSVNISPRVVIRNIITTTSSGELDTEPRN